jgi:hypothetical protein
MDNDSLFSSILEKVQRDMERAREEPIPWHRFNEDEKVMLQELILAGHQRASILQHADTVWLGFTSPTGMLWELIHSEDKDRWAIHTTHTAHYGVFTKTGYKDPRKLIREFLEWEND